MDRLLDKVRKLLELSRKNDNVHEASAAAAKAQQLMEEHRITEAMLEAGKPVVERIEESIEMDVLEEGRKRYVDAWRWHLASTLCAINGCAWFQYEDEKGIAHLHLIGRRSDIEAVRYLYRYLTLEILRLCQEGAIFEREAMSDPESDQFLRPEKRGDELLKWRNSFKLGAKDEICERLYTAQRAAREAAWNAAKGKGTELALVRDALATVDARKQAATDTASRAFGVRTTKSRSGTLSNGAAYGAGRAAGRSVNLAPGAALPESSRRLK